jgi:ectoine hydroxylase-related dioxygenase (phytanoyl-CoA dioxygenase family)
MNIQLMRFPLPTPRQDLLIPARKTFCVEPKDGMLIIFRSNLQHMVHENKTNKNRITFAMNFIVDVEND